MYLHKAPGVPAKPEASLQNTAASKAPLLAQAVKPAVPPLPQAVTAAVPRSVFSLVAAAGLPADALSASIVSFARFFSLPIKPELMAEIRRQAFIPTDAGQSREAFALAAAAAEAKGVELSPKGLEWFAEAINPDGQKRQNAEERNQREKNQYEQEPKTGPMSAEGLKKTALEAEEQNPLLAILNQLPGKDNKRWIVFPFRVSDKGREFTVSLRVLIDMADHIMTVDITESGDNMRRWLFIMHEARDSLIVYVQPETPEGMRTSFAGELSRLLHIPLERILVKNRLELFPFEAMNEENMLYSIYEAV